MTARRGFERGSLACAAMAAVLGASAIAAAQVRGGRGRPTPPPRDSAPAPSNTNGDASGDEPSPPPPRTEPEIAPPPDPLAIPPEVSARIGSDWSQGPPGPVGPVDRKQWFPYYEERQGDFRLRLLPPFFVEQTRGLRDPSQRRYGIPNSSDTEGLYSLLYYRRRSPEHDRDVLFPLFWRIREGESHTLVLGPWLHREAPYEHDNWLAPLYFEGKRKDGGYFHAPLLLTSSHWGLDSAFTLVGPYFRNRSGTNVDMGVAPFFFHGDNGNVEGGRNVYTVIPPFIFYHASHEIDSSSITVAGPVITQSDPKRDVFDLAPLFFHIRGKPESGGVDEEHTTLLPFFHYGHDPDKTLFILPGYYRRVAHDSDTLLSLLYSHVTTRNGSTSLTAVGPVIPLWWDYRDRDVGVHTWALAPFIMHSQSPSEHDWLTPLAGRFETYGESTTWWFFPTFTISSGRHGWENDFHPLVYVGRNDDSSHTVIAPVFWDFASAKGRTTVGFPLYWRFADSTDGSVLQVAANTLYMQKKVPGGIDWQFHLLPLFSYGENPEGYFWNVLFGLAGYSQYANTSQVRAFWLPINLAGGSQPAASHTADAR